MQPKRYLITTALPYANGPLHIGHLAGVYVPADIYVRYLRIRKQDVIFIGGSDEHGVPITIKARNEGVTPQDIVDKYHTLIKESFAQFGISFDIYSRTTSRTHYQTASEFFRTLYNKGKFIEQTTEQYYDPEVKQYLADRYITGTCPKCDNDSAYGDQCEKCGSSLNATDLINPKSTISGAKPILKETKHWYLPLNEYEPWLREWILEQHKEWKPNVYGQCKSWIDGGLQPRAVSRDLDWGVPVPVDGATGKVLYVWFDAPIGYISATKEFTSEWEKYWKDKETKLVHFIGKDNIVFHCIIFPSMLKAEGSYILPENVPANEFLNLEGDKISTSRNWAVWLHEYLQTFKGKEDILRYVLTAAAPETKDNDFTWADFQARNNNEIVAVYGNFVNRALVLTQKYFNGQVPSITQLTEYDERTIQEIGTIRNKVETLIENYRFRDALYEAMNMARIGNKYLAETEPWKIFKEQPERVATILNLSLQITAGLTIIMEPFMPFSSEKLRQMLNIGRLDWEKAGLTNIITPGHKINQPQLLFEKIDDSTIAQQIERLNNIKTENQTNNNTACEQLPDISFEEFTKSDLRICTILKAEKISKTKKLMKLLVDTGIDERTVVSGIAEHYSPDEIIGKQVSMIINLQPRTIKGIESHGMILMAQDENGKLQFVSPQSKVKNGCQIK